jgi:DNA polymerase III alpha subunit (gram-positive type)
VYIKPTTKINSKASLTTKLTYTGGELYHAGIKCKTVPRLEAWTSFINFLKNIGKVVLVCHNMKFDASFMISELRQLNILHLISGIVIGFADNLPLFRKCIPELTSHAQSVVVSHILGASYIFAAHNAVGDVKALSDVLMKMDLSISEILQYSCTIESYIQHLHSLSSEKEMSVLKIPRIVTVGMIKMLAEQQWTLKKLLELASTSGEQGFVLKF